jgi:eukaryotic-like serine/threonine-protein kinase
MIGTTISHYRILEEVGKGGMGVVYKAEDTRLGRLVALKFLPTDLSSDPIALDRFRREARAASALNHPNICTIHDIGEEDGCTFMVMEYLEGSTLKQLIAGNGPLPLPRLLAIATDVLDGLQAAHELGILHRDIKPANIYVNKHGHAKILDFGLAKMKSMGDPSGGDSRSDTGGWALGTIANMSPEQALGKPLDERSDLFSFGTVLYEMATGKGSFRGDSTGTLFLSVVQDAPEPPREVNPDVPEKLDAIIRRCLQKDRSVRYQNAAELLADLQELQSGVGSSSSIPVPALASDDWTRPVTPKEPAAKLRSPWFGWSILGIVLAFLSLAGTVYFIRGGTPKLKEKDTIVLAEFTNSAGDPVFDGSLRQALSVELAQSPFLNIISDRTVASTMRLMNRLASERLTRTVTREICQRTNSTAYIAGSISRDSDHYHLELQALNCADDHLLASTDAKATTRDGVLAALGSAGRAMRRKLGESLPSVERFNKPLPEATTSSLEALKEFSTGNLARQQGAAAALPHFQRVVEIDPNFASAYRLLAGAYFDLNQRGLGVQAYTRAFELRHRVTERERFEIESAYNATVLGDRLGNIENCRRWLKSYPNNPTVYSRMGLDYLAIGDAAKSAELLREQNRLSPETSAAYVNLTAVYMRLGRFDEAHDVFKNAKTRSIDSEALRTNRMDLAFLESDATAIQAELSDVAGKPNFEDRLLAEAAAINAFFGRFAKAREGHAKANTLAQSLNLSGRISSNFADLAVAEAHAGNFAAAKKDAQQALTLSDPLFVAARVALALAFSGDSTSAENVLKNNYGNAPQQNVLVHRFYLPTVRAVIEINKNHPEKAIELLEPALSYEMGVGELYSLEPAYVRGVAYLKLGKGAEASKEFQKLIANPGIVGTSLQGPLARLQLARAERLLGNNDAARDRYQDFLGIWKDADPDLPVLKQAKAEYASLKN